MQKPSQDFNSCNDFLVHAILSHILTAALAMLRMKDIPSTNLMSDAQTVWMETVAERKEILNKVCKQVVDTFVDFSFHGETTTNESDNIN